MKKLILLGVLVAATGLASAQTATPAPRVDTALLAFFTGRWTGEGAFANGRKIAANLSFHLSLDSCWLVYEHQDQLPNQYKATSMWGVDRATGEFQAYCFDNFHGHRHFVSNGWQNGKLILSGQAFAPQAGVYFEHFIYERMSDVQFKMTYETSRDGISWQLGDSLVFRRL